LIGLNEHQLRGERRRAHPMPRVARRQACLQ
jgi:hypothetical protein